jgi:formylglycine-generating enzyme required for sulfatase activity
MEFVRIPKGKFTMGSPKNEVGYSDDEEEIDVQISRDFYIGRFLVTQEQYKVITGDNPSASKGNRLPVENVNWEDAVKYCAALSKKLNLKASLPTEAQWEYACRAGTKTPFHFGSKLNGDLANCDGRIPYGTETKGAYKGETCAVGSYPANPWGLYDMHGNVMQWCQDWFGSYKDLETKKDPVQMKPQSKDIKVLRGGCWATDAIDSRSAGRCWTDPRSRTLVIGFRVCLALEK